MKPIECTLKVLEEEDNKPKVGRYMSTWYTNMNQIGKKKFPVALRIEADFDALVEQGMDLEEIALGCVEFLNIIKQPKRGRRRKKSDYGKLELYFEKIPKRLREKKRGGKKESARAKLIETEEGKYLEVIVSTDNSKVRKFAGSALKR